MVMVRSFIEKGVQRVLWRVAINSVSSGRRALLVEMADDALLGKVTPKKA